MKYKCLVVCEGGWRCASAPPRGVHRQRTAVAGFLWPLLSVGSPPQHWPTLPAAAESRPSRRQAAAGLSKHASGPRPERHASRNRGALFARLPNTTRTPCPVPPPTAGANSPVPAPASVSRRSATANTRSALAPRRGSRRAPTAERCSAGGPAPPARSSRVGWSGRRTAGVRGRGQGKPRNRRQQVERKKWATARCEEQVLALGGRREGREPGGLFSDS